MYGTHYSSAAITLFYLLRLEPFTTLQIAFQSGRFDHADRLFHDISETYQNALNATGDVKELIPEFFFLPEFLENRNNFQFGRRQTGAVVDDVVLPPWAVSAYEFVRLHREALESDFVSLHLHHWIDLVFGYKQTGPEAVAAYNVFHHLSYDGAVDLDAVADPEVRKVYESQALNFGLTPSRLLTKPHPARAPRLEVPLTLRYDTVDPTVLVVRTWAVSAAASAVAAITAPPAAAGGATGGGRPSISGALAAAQRPGARPHVGPRLCYVAAVEMAGNVAILGGADVVIAVDDRGVISRHRLDRRGLLLGRRVGAGGGGGGLGGSGGGGGTTDRDLTDDERGRLGAPFAHDVEAHPALFAVSPDGRFLYTAGHWDRSFRVLALDTFRQVQAVVAHDDAVTCLALAEDGRTLVTGSRDTTLMTWEVDPATGAVGRVPLQVLHGHDSEVTAVAVNADHDLVVSGSRDGTCIVYTMRGGQYVRTLQLYTHLARVHITTTGGPTAASEAPAANRTAAAAITADAFTEPPTPTPQPAEPGDDAEAADRRAASIGIGGGNDSHLGADDPGQGRVSEDAQEVDDDGEDAEEDSDSDSSEEVATYRLGKRGLSVSEDDGVEDHAAVAPSDTPDADLDHDAAASDESGLSALFHDVDALRPRSRAPSPLDLRLSQDRDGAGAASTEATATAAASGPTAATALAEPTSEQPMATSGYTLRTWPSTAGVTVGHIVVGQDGRIYVASERRGVTKVGGGLTQREVSLLMWLRGLSLTHGTSNVAAAVPRWRARSTLSTSTAGGWGAGAPTSRWYSWYSCATAGLCWRAAIAA